MALKKLDELRSENQAINAAKTEIEWQMIRMSELDSRYREWCAIDPRFAELFVVERINEEKAKLERLMQEFAEETFPRYFVYCQENLSTAITDEMKQGDIAVKLLPLPATSEILQFEVESTIKLSSVPGV